MWRANQKQSRDAPLGVASQHNTLAVCRVASIQVDCYCCSGFFPKCLLGSSAIFMMADNKEQRLCVKFCFLLGKSVSSSFLFARPCAMRLFPVPPRMKGQMKGKRFADVSEVKKKTLKVLNNISSEKISINVFSNGKNVGTSVSS